MDYMDTLPVYKLSTVHYVCQGTIKTEVNKAEKKKDLSDKICEVVYIFENVRQMLLTCLNMSLNITERKFYS